MVSRAQSSLDGSNHNLALMLDLKALLLAFDTKVKSRCDINVQSIDMNSIIHRLFTFIDIYWCSGHNRALSQCSLTTQPLYDLLIFCGKGCRIAQTVSGMLCCSERCIVEKS